MDISRSLLKVHKLDELAEQDTVIHRLHPVVKLLVTVIYLSVVVSFHKYEISGLLPLLLYPVIIAVSGDVPLRVMLTGLAAAAPFVIGIGVFNPLLDRELGIILFGVEISKGVLSFASLLLKCILTVFAALILISTTGMNKLAEALHKLHIPKIFIVQLLLTYRYITVLADEAARAYNAYKLRAPEHKGIARSLWGAFLGQLLLRTLDRAQRIFYAMKLRGFQHQSYFAAVQKVAVGDVAYLAVWTAYFGAVRFIDLPLLMGQLITGGIK